MELRGYGVDVLTRVGEIRTLASGWDVLAGWSGSPLLGADWFLACAETLCAESDLRVIVVRSKDSVCAVAPLVVVRRDGVEWLELLGVSALYEPSGLLYDGLDSLHHLVKKIVSLRMPTVLARIPAESPIEATFRTLTRYRGIVVSRRTASAAYVCTKGTWEDYFHSMSGQRRYDYQRKRKRTERLGQVTVRIERPDSQGELQHMLDQVFRVEGAGWKGRSGSSLLSNERVRNFIVQYSRVACGRGELRVCFLEVKGIPIATILGIECARRFWVLKIGYNEQWSRCSPGIQMTMETIHYAFDKGLEGYEFLGSEEPWQSTWPRHRHALNSLVLYPVSIQGLWAFGSAVQRFAMKGVPHLRGAVFGKSDHVSE